MFKLITTFIMMIFFMTSCLEEMDNLHSKDGKDIYTVAYEDSYPNAGDGDYNDYVLIAANDAEKNQKGLITKIKARYQLVAKGSKLNHIMKIRLPVLTSGSFRHKVIKPNGNTFKDETYSVISAEQFNNGITIMPESNTIIRAENVHKGEKYRPGMIAEVEINFDFPVPEERIGKAPYDLFLVTENKDNEIHMNGYSASYVNTNGFPTAFAVPGIWNWPYEGYSLYKKDGSGYKEFTEWTTSGGKESKKWYYHISDASKLYPIPETDIAGYLSGTNKKNILLISVILLFIGAIMIVLLKRNLSVAT